MADEDAKDSKREEPTQFLVSQQWLNWKLALIEEHQKADVLSIYGEIMRGMEHRVRTAVEGLAPRREQLLIIIDTPGGVVEVAERIVKTVRHYYDDVRFLVPDRAMSAGTVLVMSGDAILMDHFSCLGPVDPQVERELKLVPALSYLAQYDRLVKRAEEGKLTSAELVLLQGLDLAELHQFELARELSVDLIKDWLVRYKFKDWTETETHKYPVTDAMKKDRAETIARELNKQERWGSHGRGINRETLEELGLKIDDLDADPALRELARDYLGFLRDYLVNNQILNYVHSRTFI